MSFRWLLIVWGRGLRFWRLSLPAIQSFSYWSAASSKVKAPVFACSVAGSPQDRVRSADVQCTVFRITTPTGETFTLPLSQIAMIHSLSDALINRLEAAAEAQAAALEAQEDEKLPFGFAAYTSLKASEDESNPTYPAI